MTVRFTPVDDPPEEKSRPVGSEAAESEYVAKRSDCDQSIAIANASQQAERSHAVSPQIKSSNAVPAFERAVLTDTPATRYGSMSLGDLVVDVTERAIAEWVSDDGGLPELSEMETALLELTNVAIAKHNDGRKKGARKLRPLDALTAEQSSELAAVLDGGGAAVPERYSELSKKLLGYAAEHEDGQIALGYYFAAATLGRCMFVPGLGWHVYDGMRWQLDEDAGSARDLMQEVLREAAATRAPELRKLKTAAAIRGALEVAETAEGIRVFAAELDADPWVLNCTNGTLDLKTFELRPHDPADRLTKVTNAAYAPDAQAPTWEAFLERSLPDPEVRAFVQRYSGMGLVGLQLLHSLLVHHGLGRNGKGVFYEARGHVLGDYYHHAPSDLFEVTRGGGGADAPKPARLALRGCRSVTISETDKNMRVDTAQLKALTGGDRITARALHKTVQVSFTPTYSMEMITNFMPQLPADDLAIWERVTAVPWDVVIPRAERDPMLGEKLKDEADGILAWIVVGLREFEARGLDEPDAVRAKTGSYQEDQDDFKRFVEERCEPAPTPSDELTVRKLRDAYTSWAASENIPRSKILNSKEFSTALGKHGYEIRKAKQGMVCGLRLAVFEDPDEADDAATAPSAGVATPSHEPTTPAQKRQREQGLAHNEAMQRATGGAPIVSGAPRQRASEVRPLEHAPEEVFEAPQ